ncbi:MAG: hypothetical protein ACOH10_15375 [Rhodoglobus sp.]
MSQFDYTQSSRIARSAPSFNSLIMAALRTGSASNVALLGATFPAIYTELAARHNTGGHLPTDPVTHKGPL